MAIMIAFILEDAFSHTILGLVSSLIGHGTDGAAVDDVPSRERHVGLFSLACSVNRVSSRLPLLDHSQDEARAVGLTTGINALVLGAARKSDADFLTLGDRRISCRTGRTGGGLRRSNPHRRGKAVSCQVFGS